MTERSDITGGDAAAIGLEQLKQRVRGIGTGYANDREHRAKRLFIEERAASLHFDRENEFLIRNDIARFFDIPYAAVAFAGSAQLGFSIHKDKLFEPGVSDLDAACINATLFQRAWSDVIETTRAFSDGTPFGRRSAQDIEQFKDQILRRGMIRIDAMPQSDVSRKWSAFQGRLSRKHTALFQRISIAVYMNEYAFCWKQDSALVTLMRKSS